MTKCMKLKCKHGSVNGIKINGIPLPLCYFHLGQFLVKCKVTVNFES